MRDYAKVSPQFWTGRTGKDLKAAGPEAVIVAMYLMTSPHANMIGVYHCPIGYIVIDTGLPIEGATKGLQRAIEAGFCTFEADTDYVFVHAFAEYQIGTELDPKDLRCKGVANELAKVPKGQCWQGFRARYAVPFHLPVTPNPASPFEAPPKPGAGAGAGAGAEEGTGTEEKTKAERKRSPATTEPKPRPGKKCPESFVTTPEMLQWATESAPLVNVDAETAAFRDHTFKNAITEWPGTWRNWMRRANEFAASRQPRGRVNGTHVGAMSEAGMQTARNAEALGRRLFGESYDAETAA